ncbi:putative methyltransferase-domain-containing protein [Geopyxis carbonaria]|nr:putative methyltransferase-domain-containing protein [Geopyxis carbonaria]
MDLFDNSDSEIEPLGSDLVAPAPILRPRTTETDFGGLLDTHLKLHEDLAKGCGGQIWPAGEILTKYLLRRYKNGENSLKGKRIVELGAGGGLVGLAVAAGCDLEGSELYITDMHAMIDLIHKNLELNDMQNKKEVKVELLDWANPAPKVIVEKPVDFIIAADCVYYEPAFPLLEKTLVDLVSENTIVFFCFKKRRRADLTFMKAIKKRLKVREIKDDPNFSKEDTDYPQYHRENLFMYIMSKKV